MITCDQCKFWEFWYGYGGKCQNSNFDSGYSEILFALGEFPENGLVVENHDADQELEVFTGRNFGCIHGEQK